MGAIDGEKALNDVPRFGVHVTRNVQLPRENLLVDTDRVLVVKRRVSVIQVGRAGTFHGGTTTVYVGDVPGMMIVER